MRIPTKLQLRSLWLKIHKWIGLALAAPVILIFLSGSALVWKENFDALLHPSRQIDQAPSKDPSFYAAAAARGLEPGEHIASLTYPSGKGAVLVTVANGDAPERTRYFLHPASGRLIDRSPLYDRPMLLLHKLHGSLLMNWMGSRIVAWISVILLASAFSGLWLWWPMKGPWARGLRWARTQSTNTNIHHQAGFWIAIPLVVLSLTGASITFPRVFNRLLGHATAVRAEAARSVAPPLDHPRLTIRQALAKGGFDSESRLKIAVWPTVMDGHWHFQFIGLQGVHSVTVDDAKGESTPFTPEPETTMRLMRRVHDGTGMPLLWQILIFLTGLVGPLLAVTGVIIWFSGRTREKEMRERRGKRVEKP